MALVPDSVRRKIARAAEHVDAVEKCVRAYAASNPCEVVRQPNGRERVRILREPPIDIALFAGEVLYQLRSSLDHVAFELVRLNPSGITLDAGWDDRCQFPLLTQVPTKGKPPVPCVVPLPYGFFRNLPGITVQAHAFIESVQPYNTHSPCRLGRVNTLEIIKKLSNIDKHRRLNILARRVRKQEWVTYHTGVRRGGWYPMDNGAELEQTIGSQSPMGRAVNVERSFETIVAFDEATLPDVKEPPVEYVLKLCSYAVETFIIPAFEKLV